MKKLEKASFNRRVCVAHTLVPITLFHYSNKQQHYDEKKKKKNWQSDGGGGGGG